jgi:hypothetical protein
MAGAAADDRHGRGVRRSFSARARHAAVLQAPGHSREETAEIVGVAPETVSVWKRHPRWQVELDRWRELALAPFEMMQLRLKLESLDATSEACEQLLLIMASASKRVRTPTGLAEAPDWSTQLKACRLVSAAAWAIVPELRGASKIQADRRTLRILP